MATFYGFLKSSAQRSSSKALLLARLGKDVAAIDALNSVQQDLGYDLYQSYLAKESAGPLVDSTPTPEELEPEEQVGAFEMTDLRLHRTNPKRYDPTPDWYTSVNEHGNDSPVSNRYDNPQEVASSLEALNWEIDRLVEGVGLHHPHTLDLFDIAPTLLKRYRLATLHKGQCLTFSQIPDMIWRFLGERFASELENNQGLRDLLAQVYVEFVPRPSSYRSQIGAEYIPELNCISYYLPRNTLAKTSTLHWAGVVHELAHAIQHYFQGGSDLIAPPPVKSDAYISDRRVYASDPGERHAYSVEQEFLVFVNTSKEL